MRAHLAKATAYREPLTQDFCQYQNHRLQIMIHCIMSLVSVQSGADKENS